MRKWTDKHTRMLFLLGFFIAYVTLRICVEKAPNDDIVTSLILKLLTGD